MLNPLWQSYVIVGEHIPQAWKQESVRVNHVEARRITSWVFMQGLDHLAKLEWGGYEPVRVTRFFHNERELIQTAPEEEYVLASDTKRLCIYHQLLVRGPLPAIMGWLFDTRPTLRGKNVWIRREHCWLPRKGSQLPLL